MSELETLRINCRGKEAIVEVVGFGPDVIFVGTAAPMMWSRPAALALAAHGFRVVNFDYGSGAADPLPRSALDQVSDVLDVMAATGVESGAAVGMSRGAMTAYGLAARNPKRVSELVLVFPVCGFADTIGIDQPNPEPEPGETDTANMRRLLETVFSVPFLDTNLDDAIALATMPPGGVARLDRADEQPFADDDRVVCPMLIIEGGGDQVVSGEHPARYVEAVPEAEHVVVPGAAHGWIMEDPEEFATMVAEFLSRRPTAPRAGEGSGRSQPV